ncbi:MAG: autotransporter assembly complex family protein [Thiobacillaceae bacterium]
MRKSACPNRCGIEAILAKVIAMMALLLPAYGLAAPPVRHYEIQLDAPASLVELLQNNLDIYQWQGSPQMDAGYLTVLLKRTPEQIRELLETEGYYNPVVEVNSRPDSPLPLVDIHIDPGLPVRVETFALNISGGCADNSRESQAQLKQLQNDWKLPKGAIFRHADWETAKRKALLPYLVSRCPAAKLVDSHATVDPKANTVQLTIEIDTGPVFHFGPTEIKGLRRYPASIVDRLNPTHAGEIYSQDKVLLFQSRLRDSLYFSTVSVVADTSVPADLGDKVRSAPIQVNVVEHAARKLSFGAGYSTDTGPRGRVQYGDLNLASQAWRLDTQALVGNSDQSLTGNIVLPLTASGYQDSLHGKAEHTDIEGQTTQTYNIGAKRTKVRGKIETALSLEYTTEVQGLGTLPSDRSRALYLGYSWTHRAVDNVVNPNHGYIYNIQLGGAASSILSDQDFLRGYTRGILFVPVSKSGQLILRSELGGVWAPSRTGIPEDYLFRTGGDQSVRGYSYQSLGVSQAGATVGGRWLAVGSTEYVHWLLPQWGAAVFADLGDAADSINTLSPKLGYGIGARWKSPVGPLGLDVAYGRETREFRLHFSASLAF